MLTGRINTTASGWTSSAHIAPSPVLRSPLELVCEAEQGANDEAANCIAGPVAVVGGGCAHEADCPFFVRRGDGNRRKHVMPSLPVSQLTLNFEPALSERFRTLREYIGHRVNVQSRPAKTIAAGMDMSPSMLSRKLTAGVDPDDKDTQRFNCDDLEAYLAESGDVAAVIEYLAAKFMHGGDEGRRARALSSAERLLAELSRVLPSLREKA